MNEVKEKLRITWDYEDSRITSMINESTATIDGLVGCKLDYSDIRRNDNAMQKRLKGLARSLLFNRIFYEYNNQLHDFEKNYMAEILRLQLFVAGGNGV